MVVKKRMYLYLVNVMSLDVRIVLFFLGWLLRFLINTVAIVLASIVTLSVSSSHLALSISKSCYQLTFLTLGSA